MRCRVHPPRSLPPQELVQRFNCACSSTFTPLDASDNKHVTLALAFLNFPHLLRNVVSGKCPRSQQHSDVKLQP